VITIIIGGSEQSSEVRKIKSTLNSLAKTLDANEDSFVSCFFRWSTASTNKIITLNKETGVADLKTANDDFNLLFTDEYLKKYPNKERLFGVVDLILGLKLDIQVIAVHKEAMNSIMQNWPLSWPPPRLFKENDV